MGQLEDRYISLLTDFGFKRIFNRFFAEAKIAVFNKDELHEYEDNLNLPRH